MLTFGANIGIALSGQFISMLNKYTSPYFMDNMGWRLLFLFGSLLAFIGIYIRKFVSETEEFVHFKKFNKAANTPLYTLLNHHTPQIIKGVLLCLVVSLVTSIFHVFLPSLLNTHYFYNLSHTTNISSIGATTMAVFSLIFAYLTKYINPIKIIKFSLLALSITLGIILFVKFNLNYFIIEVIIISIFVAGINGLFFGLLSDLFPVNVRYSGISICYNTSYILGALMG